MTMDSVPDLEPRAGRTVVQSNPQPAAGTRSKTRAVDATCNDARL